jgi:hypothetical protein
MKKLLLLSAFILLLPTCQKTTEPSDDDSGSGGGGGGATTGLIRFRVLCPLNKPLVAGVRIFDENSGDRLVSSSSNSNGEFCSLSRLPLSGRYRIQIYELPTDRCVRLVTDVRFPEDEELWVNSCSDSAVGIIGTGACSGNATRSDCW